MKWQQTKIHNSPPQMKKQGPHCRPAASRFHVRLPAHTHMNGHMTRVEKGGRSRAGEGGEEGVCVHRRLDDEPTAQHTHMMKLIPAGRPPSPSPSPPTTTIPQQPSIIDHHHHPPSRIHASSTIMQPSSACPGQLDRAPHGIRRQRPQPPPPLLQAAGAGGQEALHVAQGGKVHVATCVLFAGCVESGVFGVWWVAWGLGLGSKKTREEEEERLNSR